MKQENMEQKVFRKFARHHPAKIILSSIRVANPPKPDIEADCRNGEIIAFEISEIIDQNMYRRLTSRLDIANLCREYYKSLQGSEKTTFISKYDDSSIYIVFQDKISSVKKKKSIPNIFNYLLSLDTIEKENVPKEKDLKKIVKKIRISSRIPGGPFFDTDSTGFIGCPFLNRVKEKFDKTYTTNYSCELLLYYNLQPEVVSKHSLADTLEYMQKNIHKTTFRRVWVYSFHNDNILADIKRANDTVVI